MKTSLPANNALGYSTMFLVSGVRRNWLGTQDGRGMDDETIWDDHVETTETKSAATHKALRTRPRRPSNSGKV